MTHALRWVAMRAILKFHKLRGTKSQLRQCPQTTIFEEKGEPKRIRTEALVRILVKVVEVIVAAVVAVGFLCYICKTTQSKNTELLK